MLDLYKTRLPVATFRSDGRINKIDLTVEREGSDFIRYETEWTLDDAGRLTLSKVEQSNDSSVRTRIQQQVELAGMIQLLKLPFIDGMEPVIGDHTTSIETREFPDFDEARAITMEDVQSAQSDGKFDV
ncbi:hypothetical protein [Halosegnis longus]|uniref:hypothetical protein n=1 Tax=Halosegnis longus TaxID=2216012 RepID=UPI00129E1CD3|nr:hypothetical protein [Halosegnis longus]